MLGLGQGFGASEQECEAKKIVSTASMWILNLLSPALILFDTLSANPPPPSVSSFSQDSSSLLLLALFCHPGMTHFLALVCERLGMKQGCVEGLAWRVLETVAAAVAAAAVVVAAAVEQRSFFVGLSKSVTAVPQQLVEHWLWLASRWRVLLQRLTLR